MGRDQLGVGAAEVQREVKQASAAIRSNGGLEPAERSQPAQVAPGVLTDGHFFLRRPGEAQRFHGGKQIGKFARTIADGAAEVDRAGAGLGVLDGRVDQGVLALGGDERGHRGADDVVAQQVGAHAGLVGVGTDRPDPIDDEVVEGLDEALQTGLQCLNGSRAQVAAVPHGAGGGAQRMERR